MTLTRRPISLADDLDALLNLVRQRPERHTHVIDLPYRLSSWALDGAENSVVWQDDTGKVHAWAVLQTPFWSIDLAVEDTDGQPELYAEALAWADRRAEALAGSVFGRPAWFVNVFEERDNEIRALERAGFTCQTNVAVDPWLKVQMVRELKDGEEAAPTPAGFTIRELRGEAEVDGYVALHRAAFGSENMRPDWRRRTLQQPAYCADLDLVAQAADGRLAAFCIGWYDPGERRIGPAGQVEPLGVHPDFQRRGLGRALLAEIFRRAARRGVRRMYVECDDYPDGLAYALYRSAGFVIHKKIAIYRKDYGQNPE